MGEHRRSIVGRGGERPVRIAYVIGGLDTGGAEYQLYELVRHLDRRRYAPTVFVLSAGGYWVEPIRRVGVPVIELPQRHRLEPSRLLRLRSALRQAAPDVLHTILWSGNSYGRLAGFGLGVPVTLAAERNVIRRPAWQRWFERALDRTTTAYLTNAGAVVAELAERGGLPAAKMHVVHNGVDLELLPPFRVDRRAARAALGFDPGRRLVAQVGRLEPQKDYPTFVHAMGAVARSCPDVDFLIVGDGGERERIRAALREAGIAERTRLLGVRHDVPAILAAVDVMVLASRWEGLPNVVIEAMATGAATIATDVGGCRELLADGAGRVVAVGDHVAIAAVVRALLGDEPMRLALVMRARRRVEEELSVARMVEATVTLYERLLAEARR